MRTWNYTEKQLRRVESATPPRTRRRTRAGNTVSAAFVPPEAALLAARLREERRVRDVAEARNSLTRHRY